MSTKYLAAKLSSLLLLASLSACSGAFYKIPTAEVDSKQYEVVGTDSVTATGINLFGFIPINLNDKIQRATEQLINKYQGDAVTDISVQERWFWAWVLTGYKTEISATVIKKK